MKTFLSLLFLILVLGCQNPAVPPVKDFATIAWNLDTDLSHGLQDNAGGFIDNFLVMTGGYCLDYTYPSKPGKYTGGFLASTWAFDLTSHHWIDLPDYPGGGRQGLVSAVVNNELYVWGGLNYTSPNIYSSGWKLSLSGSTWAWSAIPDLPQAVVWAGAVSVGTKIYVLGGSWYGLGGFKTDTTGKNMYILDTANLVAGWTAITFPGSPRATFNISSDEVSIFIIGGAYLQDTTPGTFYNIIDNWSYNTLTSTWKRLADLPVNDGVYSSQQSMYKNRYVLLCGGYQYDTYMDLNGVIKPKYGEATRDKSFTPFDPKFPPYLNDNYIYDTYTDTFATATKLPFNTSGSMEYIKGDDIWLIGGEIDQGVILGEWFWHHPDLMLHGKITL